MERDDGVKLRQNGKSDGEMEKEYRKEIIEWVEAISIALVVAFLIRAFVFQLILVEGPSMENTLAGHDRLIVYKLGYVFGKPKPGDIIVFQHVPGPIKLVPFLFETDYIKRVIAVAGQTVDIKDGKVYVDGKALKEPYTHDRTYASMGMEGGGMKFPVKIPQNKIFVLGDNRINSRDSRFSDVGFVDLKKVKGKAVFRVWPLNRIGRVY